MSKIATSTSSSSSLCEPLNNPTLTLPQRVFSASCGALLTSLIVTPFDVVKTRLQAQSQIRDLSRAPSPAQCPHCADFEFQNGLMDHRIPKARMPAWFCSDHQLRGTLDGLIKISRHEGIGGLYNGLPPTLLMAIPATALYFAVYDTLHHRLCEHGLGGFWAPMLSGSYARLLAATTIAPLELLRTKSQASHAPQSMARMAAEEVRISGTLSLWRGLSPTLLRDVPFSAVYWVCVEKAKVSLCSLEDRLPDQAASAITALIAGVGGGLVAATLTIPFDVVKTRRQVFAFAVGVGGRQPPQTIWQIMRDIITREGVGGLFVGIMPRLAKVAPACGIMLCSYELGKNFFLSAS